MDYTPVAQSSKHYKKLVILVVVLFVIQLLVSLLSATGIFIYIKKITGDTSQDEDENDLVGSRYKPQQQMLLKKLNRIESLLDKNYRALDETTKNEHASMTKLMNRVLKILESDENNSNEEYEEENDDYEPNELNFSKLEIQNFKHILGREKYSIRANIQVKDPRDHPYMHILTFPFNFQLHVYMHKKDEKPELYLKHLAGAFQAFYMMYSRNFTLEYAKRKFSNIVRYGYRYSDRLYPGPRSTSGVYYPNGPTFYVRDRYGYEVDAHEFVHMLDFHISPEISHRESEQYVDGMANLLSGECKEKISKFPTLKDLVQGVGVNLRYTFGPPLVAVLLSNEPLRIFHARFTNERSNHQKDYVTLERHLVERYSHFYNSSVDYCRVFFAGTKRYSDFWDDGFLNQVSDSLANMNEYLDK